MPNISNIAVLKADGVTNITWTGDSGSGGDKQPARYSSKTVSPIPAYQPKMAVASEQNGDGSVRRMRVNIVYPYTVTDSTTGLPVEVARHSFQGVWNISQEIPSTVTDEFVVQTSNLLDHSDLIVALKAQQAPT